MPVDSPNRRLIRPPLAKKDPPGAQAQRTNNVQRKQMPPDTTNAENFYYVKQMQAKTPMVVVLKDGEELHGVIEWYDKQCIKLTREGAPNLLVYKAFIKYLYKA